MFFADADVKVFLKEVFPKIQKLTESSETCVQIKFCSNELFSKYTFGSILANSP
jgi:hypothetical protein